MNNKLHKVNGICSSGKTYALTHHIKKNSEFQKSIIVVPTKILASQYKKSFADGGAINYKVINRDYTDNVHSDIIKTINHINKTRFGTLVITLAAFDTLNLDIFGDRSQWYFYCDEIPMVDFYYEPCIPYHNNMLMNALNIQEQITPTLYRLSLNPNWDVKSFLQRNHDDIDAVIRPIIQHLVQQDEVIVDTKNWDKLSRQIITNDKDVDLSYGNAENKQYIIAFRSPARFQSWAQTTILGANFDESMLYKYWTEFCDIEFSEHQLQGQLRLNKHKNGNLLNITYLQEYSYSKKQGGKKLDNGLTIREDAIQKALNHFKNDKVLCVVNKDDKKLIPEAWTDCPVVSHGLNSYQDYTQMYFGAALNRTPKHIKMLEEYGIDSGFILRCTTHEVVYQNVSRTALRDPDNKIPCDVIVQDRLMAEALARLYPNCTIAAIDGVRMKAIPKSKSHCMKNKRLQSLIEHRLLNNTIFINNIDELHNWHSAVTNSYIVGFSNTEMPKLQGNCFPDIYSQSIDTYESTSISEFVQEMKQWHTNNIIGNKNNNVLINSVIYKDNTRRSLDNAIYSTALFIDIDDGDLSPEEFHRIFSEVYPISHFVTNSASRSAAQPNRYRAVFFVKEVMNDDTYRIVHQHIISLLDKQEYKTIPLMPKEKLKEYLEKYPNAKFTGVDMSKNNLSSIFYAPCQIIGHEDHAFFWNHGTNNRDVNRYALCPTKIIQHTLFPEDLSKVILVDVNKLYTNSSNTHLNLKSSRHYKEVLEMITQLRPGHRSEISCSIGGKIKYYDREIQDEIFQSMREQGCDNRQIKSAQRYANKR
jgi:hypothetical protein